MACTQPAYSSRSGTQWSTVPLTPRTKKNAPDTPGKLKSQSGYSDVKFRQALTARDKQKYFVHHWWHMHAMSQASVPDSTALVDSVYLCLRYALTDDCCISLRFANSGPRDQYAVHDAVLRWCSNRTHAEDCWCHRNRHGTHTWHVCGALLLPFTCGIHEWLVENMRPPPQTFGATCIITVVSVMITSRGACCLEPKLEIQCRHRHCRNQNWCPVIRVVQLGAQRLSAGTPFCMRHLCTLLRAVAINAVHVCTTTRLCIPLLTTAETHRLPC